MGASRGSARVRVIGLVAAMAATALSFAAPVHAEPLYPQIQRFCLNGSGAGQCLSPAAIESTPGTGHYFVVERGNNRVSEFTPWGEFLRTWGWDVVASGPGNRPGNEFEICIPADGDVCQAGTEGDGPGQFGAEQQSLRAQGIAVDAAGA